jgi:hypothetical protein
MRACYQRPKHLIKCVFTDINIQGKPKNRKLPFFRLSICKIIHAGRVEQFPIFGYSLYGEVNNVEHVITFVIYQ